MPAPSDFSRRLRRSAMCVAVLVGLSVLTSGTAALANAGLPGTSSLASFVTASRPQWNFARANSHDSCWPEPAIDASGAQNAGATLTAYPVPGQGGCPSANSAFPTYYSVKQCTSAEVRVVYNVYLPKDGFSGSIVGEDLGHVHDWEHIIVVWTKGSDGAWYRDYLLLGRHGEHVYQDWDTAESWNAAQTSAGEGLEYPRIFVGWAKHAMFNHQGGLKDLISQYTDNEYRHADYPYWADTLVEVTDSNALAAVLDSFDWGSATSTPAVMSRALCAITADR